MSKKTVSIVLTVGGVLVLVVALLAGIFGFPHHGFGSTKVALAVIGAVIAAAGIVFLSSKKSQKLQQRQQLQKRRNPNNRTVNLSWGMLLFL
jgi:uncharacterized membrane protein